jgi:hypothetical protein
VPTIDPDIARHLARATAEIYGDAQANMLGHVSRRLARGIEEDGWAERKRAEIRRLRHEALIDIRRLGRLGPEAVRAAIDAGYEAGIAAAIGEKHIEVASGFVGTNQAAVEALASETIGAVTSTHIQILRSTLDGYRRIISEASLRGVITGTETRRTAAQMALRRFARQGVTGFIDKAGRNWMLESYTEMATRTGAGHAMLEGHLQTYQAAGRDLVIVSDAPEECPRCRPHEGRVFSISGKDKRYPSLSSARTAGLFHANCRHRLHPYIRGLTKPMTHTADPVKAGQRVRQRELERRVRMRRREVTAAKAWTAEDKATEARRELERANRMLAKSKSDLAGFIAKHDRKRLPYRETLGAI